MIKIIIHIIIILYLFPLFLAICFQQNTFIIVASVTMPANIKIATKSKCSKKAHTTPITTQNNETDTLIIKDLFVNIHFPPISYIYYITL